LVVLFSNFYIQEYVRQQKGTGFITFLKAVVDSGGSMRTLCIQKVDESAGSGGNDDSSSSSPASTRPPSASPKENGRLKNRRKHD
jgi:hypothetical protein